MSFSDLRKGKEETCRPFSREKRKGGVCSSWIESKAPGKNRQTPVAGRSLGSTCLTTNVEMMVRNILNRSTRSSSTITDLSIQWHQGVKLNMEERGGSSTMSSKDSTGCHFFKVSPPWGRAREVRGRIACGHRPHRELGRDYLDHACIQPPTGCSYWMGKSQVDTATTSSPNSIPTKRPIAKGPRMVLGYLFMDFQPNLSTLQQSWLHGSQWCVASQVFSCGLDNGLLWEYSLPLANLMLSLSMDTVTEGRL